MVIVDQFKKKIRDPPPLKIGEKMHFKKMVLKNRFFASINNRPYCSATNLAMGKSAFKAFVGFV